MKKDKETPAVEIEKPAEVEPTPEEIQATKDAASIAMFGERGTPKKAEKPKVEKPAPEPEPEKAVEKEPEVEAPVVKPKAKPSSPPVVPPLPTIPATDAPPAPPAPEQPTGLQLGKREQKILSGLKRIEKDDPRKQGLAGQMLAFWKNESEYIARWEQAHPGESFDADADEHKGFYAKEPQVDHDELEEAYEAIRIDRVRDELRKEGSAKDQKRDVDESIRQITPEVRYIADQSIAALVRAADPELAKLIPADALVINKEIADAITKADPEAVETILEETEPLSIIVSELERLARLPGKYPFNENLRVKLKQSTGVLFPHEEIMSTWKELEKELSAMNPVDAMRDNKRFLPAQVFDDYIKSIQNNRGISAASKEAQVAQAEAQYYTLTYDDLRAAFIANYAEKAKKKLGRFAAREKRKVSPETLAAVPTPKGKTKEEETPAPAPSRSRSPSISTASDTVESRKSTPSSDTATIESMEDSMWSS